MKFAHRLLIVVSTPWCPAIHACAAIRTRSRRRLFVGSMKDLSASFVHILFFRRHLGTGKGLCYAGIISFSVGQGNKSSSEGLIGATISD